MARTLPSAWSFSSASHESAYLPVPVAGQWIR